MLTAGSGGIMAFRINQRHVAWKLIAFAVGLFTLVALPVVQADAYAASDEPAITESRSVVVHVSTPGRHVLHVDTSTTVTCDACYGDEGVNFAHEISQRFAIIETVEILPLISVEVKNDPSGIVLNSVGISPESPPPRF
jgi:hypothetical protein